MIESSIMQLPESLPHIAMLREEMRKQSTSSYEETIINSILNQYEVGRWTRYDGSFSLSREEVLGWRRFDKKHYNQYETEYNKLDEGQKKFVDTGLQCSSESVIFLTGPGGSGKSFALDVLKQALKWKHTTDDIISKKCHLSLVDFVIEYVVKLSRRNNDEVLVCAPTGKAAANVGGVTYHSSAGLGIGVTDNIKSFESYCLKRMLQTVKGCTCGKGCKELSPLYYKLKNLKTLIIDEVSMMSAETLDFIDRYLQIARYSNVNRYTYKNPTECQKKSTMLCLSGLCRTDTDIFSSHIHNQYDQCRLQSFGGVQVILMGDLYQLQPVEKNANLFFEADVFHSTTRRVELHPNMHNMKRQTRRDRMIIEPIVLEGGHRFRLDPVWKETLYQIRARSLDKCLDTLYKVPIVENSLDVHLFFKNADVILHNKKRLQNLSSSIFTYPTLPYDAPDDISDQAKLALTKAQKKAPEHLHVCKNARVMLTKNRKMQKVVFKSEKLPHTNKDVDIAIILEDVCDVVNGDVGKVVFTDRDIIADDVYSRHKIGPQKPSIHNIYEFNTEPFVIVRLEKNDCLVKIEYETFSVSDLTYNQVNYSKIMCGKLAIELNGEDRKFSVHYTFECRPDSLVIDEYNNPIGIVQSINVQNGTSYIYLKPNTHARQLHHTIIKSNKLKFRPLGYQTKNIPAYAYMPIQLAWAMTTHKAQGQTFKRCVVKPSEISQYGLFYTMVSRVTSLSGLSFIGVDRVQLPDILRKAMDTNPEVEIFYHKITQYLNSKRTGIFDLVSNINTDSDTLEQ